MATAEKPKQVKPAGETYRREHRDRGTGPYAQTITGMGKDIPSRFRKAVDTLIAERMGIGLVEGNYWCGGGTEAGYTEAIRRIQGRGYMTPAGTTASHQHTEQELRQTISFRRMGRRSWYNIH